MDVQITPIDYNSPNHRWAVVSLLESYANSPQGGEMGMTEFARDEVVAMLEGCPNAMVLIAVQGEEAVGLAVCCETFSTFFARPVISLHDLVVARSHRGRRIGQRLIEAVEQEARHRGCSAVTLEVLGDNHSAMRLYRRCGFQGGESIQPVHSMMFWKKKLD